MSDFMVITATKPVETRKTAQSDGMITFLDFFFSKEQFVIFDHGSVCQYNGFR